jgi:heptaprenyl diphosphate synthase
VGFQIVDDVLDIFGEAEITGKPSGTDLKQGVMTLPVILAAKNGRRLELSRVLNRVSRSGARRISLLKLWENRTLDEARLRIEDGGGKHGALAAAELYTRRAHRELKRLPETEERGILQAVTTQLLSRVS